LAIAVPETMVAATASATVLFAVMKGLVDRLLSPLHILRSSALVFCECISGRNSAGEFMKNRILLDFQHQ
jgi:hypothetical protein